MNATVCAAIAGLPHKDVYSSLILLAIFTSNAVPFVSVIFYRTQNYGSCLGFRNFCCRHQRTEGLQSQRWAVEPQSRAMCAQKLFALARVFGNVPDALFSRSDEQRIFRAVAKAGLGPRLLVRRCPRFRAHVADKRLSRVWGLCCW